MEIYAGVMSGTSLDGADALVASFAPQPRLLGHASVEYPAALRAELLELSASGPDELDRAAAAGVELARVYAQAVTAALAAAGVSARDVTAIGCHGQTVRHRPERGYSVQLGNAALLAELSGITVVSDFRSRDLAGGGQGAPLVPAFHAALFRHPALHRVIVNVGGISNLTDLHPRRRVHGYDCAPGNVLMDAWIARHLGRAYDDAGVWAASGVVDEALLAALTAHPFFAQRPPKSTGREDFNLAWLDQFLKPNQRPQDVQATLLALTSHGIERAIRDFLDAPDEVYLCGGGAYNDALRRDLARRLAPAKLGTTDELGVAAKHVEAFAFAWLARQTMRREPGNLPEVTGAAGPRVLGAVYWK